MAEALVCQVRRISSCGGGGTGGGSFVYGRIPPCDRYVSCGYQCDSSRLLTIPPKVYAP